MPLTMDCIWAVISVDADGNENLCATPMRNPKTGERMTMPLVAAGDAKKHQIIMAAKTALPAPGHTLKLVCFSNRTEHPDVDLSPDNKYKGLIIPAKAGDLIF